MDAEREETQFDLESRIRQSLGAVLEEVRGAIQEMRGGLQQAADRLEKSLEVDWDTFIPFEKVWELEEKARATAEAPAAVVVPAEPEPVALPAPDPLPPLKAALLVVERGKTQVEVLNAFIGETLQYASRVAIFIVKGERASGWKGLGFDEHGGSNDAVKAIGIELAPGHPITSMVRQESALVLDGPGNPVAAQLGGPQALRAVVIPMLIKDKIAAAVYADSVDESMPLSVDGLEILTYFTGIAIDGLGQRQKIPSPTLTRAGAAEAATRAMPAETPRPVPAAAAPAPPRPEPPAAPSIPAPSGVSLESSFSTMAPISAASLGTAAARVNVAPPPPPPAPTPAPAAVAAPRVAEPAPAPVAPMPPPPAPAGRSVVPDEEEPVNATMAIPATMVKPAAGASRWGSVRDQQDESTKAHDEARRFARLLASEIKLYNESKVEQGKRNKDLYERLKEDIDRSRQMYEERVPENVRNTSNYFFDELVRILADGDKAALGL